MAVFEYEAMAKTGKAVRGIIDADTAAAARRKLREQALYPTRLEETSAKKASGGKEDLSVGLGRISSRDVAIMTLASFFASSLRSSPNESYNHVAVLATRSGNDRAIETTCSTIFSVSS